MAGTAWAAKVEGSICMSPVGALAGLPPAAARLAAVGSSDDRVLLWPEHVVGGTTGDNPCP